MALAGTYRVRTAGYVLMLIILVVIARPHVIARSRPVAATPSSVVNMVNRIILKDSGFNIENRVILKDFTHIIRAAKIRHDYMKEECWTCVIYNLTSDSSDWDYPCVKMQVPPHTMICLFPIVQDQVMSKTLKMNETWERGLMDEMMRWINASTDIGFIDIGANIGAYTLPIAAMGHRVVAVEPNLESVRRLHKAITLGNLSDRVTVLVNAISNQRLPTKLLRPDNNQAGIKPETSMIDATYNFDTNDFAKSIYLDDLLPFCNFSVAIMKIDIVGFEHRAMRRAELLFDNIYIPYVQMEWHEVSKAGLSDDTEEDFALFMHMLHFFMRRRYVPHTPVLGTKLSIQDWINWPPDVVWIKSYL